MDRIVKLVGALTVVAGAVLSVFALLTAMSSQEPGGGLWVIVGLSSIVSGALLYCQGALVTHMREATDNLKVLRRIAEAEQTKPASVGVRSRPFEENPGMKGIFRER